MVTDSVIVKKCARKSFFDEGDTSDAMFKGGYSVTPGMLKCATFPPWVRLIPGIHFMAFLAPGPHAFPYPQVLLQPLALELKKLASGITVPLDAFTNQADVLRRAFLLASVNDLDALPKVSLSKAASSTIGACQLCNVQGIHDGSFNRYGGAFLHLPEENQHRIKFERFLRTLQRSYRQQLQLDTKCKPPYELKLGQQGTPRRKDEEFMATAYRAASLARRSTQESRNKLPYHGEDIFSQHLRPIYLLHAPCRSLL